MPPLLCEDVNCLTDSVLHSEFQAERPDDPPDVLSGPAMFNAYHICHNVQVL